MGKIWELDFYSRPILDEKQKKRWELLICESPIAINSNLEELFKYSQFCANTSVNSLWLREAIEKAIAAAGETPKKIRFFRRSMNNMIAKACEDAGIQALPSRRTYALNQWLEERMQEFYPRQEGYDGGAFQSASVQYPAINPSPLPDALRGDRQDKWALVSLESGAFGEMNEWDISFGEAFPLSMAGLAPASKIPGLIVFSPRALPLAGWMSGLELAYLRLKEGEFPKICLETGVSDSWILANLTEPQTLAEAEGFARAKKEARGIHFLAIQTSPEAQSFAGFWLLRDSTINFDN